MCGITGAIIKQKGDTYWKLLEASEIRGQDGTGISIKSFDIDLPLIGRSELKASEAKFRNELNEGDIVIGQNRLAIFGLDHRNDQPLVTKDYSLVHNGNLVGFEELFKRLDLKREYEVDTELLLRIIEGLGVERGVRYIEDNVKGNFACLVIDHKANKLSGFRRFKPLFEYEDETGIYFFSTERIGEKVFGKQTFKSL